MILLTIICCLIATVFTPGHWVGRGEPIIWVNSKQHPYALGQLDVRGNSVRWMDSANLPKTIAAASASFDGKFLAVVSSEPLSIYIYRVQTHGRITNLTLEDTLKGFDSIFWSPDSEEALLQNTYWSNPVIWKGRDKALETISVGDDVCSADWGRNSRQIVASKCANDRALVSWDRAKRNATVLMRYNYRVQGDYAAFVTLHTWSSDRQKLLAFAYASEKKIPDRVYEMPTILSGYWQLIDLKTMRMTTLSERIDSSANRIGFFHSVDDVVIGVTANNTTELRRVHIARLAPKTQVFFECQNNCLLGVKPLIGSSRFLLNLGKPVEPLSVGIYEGIVGPDFRPIKVNMDMDTQLLPANIGHW